MFTIEGFYNPYLSSNQTRLDTVLTITSDAAVAQNVQGELNRKVVGFVLDTSGSMNGEKLAQAKLAARRGIDLLTDDIWFFVIKFAGRADIVVEACPATAQNKANAHQSVQQLNATGSTAMSTGLKLALSQVRLSGASIASVYFQTDGDNSPDDNERHLPAVISECAGVFECDCRGIGTDWKPEELRRISSVLMGTADAITDPAGLEEDFRSFLHRSMAKGIADVALRIWSPKAVKVALVKQMSPDMIDLMPMAKRIDEKTLEIQLGAWSSEARDYQLAFELPSGNIGDEVLACRATVVFKDSNGEVKVPCQPIAVCWSEDDTLTTRISREVAHYTGQKELADSIQQGLDAKASGDDDRATRLLGRAAKLAAESGNDEVTRRLKKVVDVVDASAGTVRLRKADKGADMELEMGLTRTVRRHPRPAISQN